MSSAVAKKFFESPFGKKIDNFDDRVDEYWEPLRGTEPADRIFYALSAGGEFGMIWVLLILVWAARKPDKRSELLAAIPALAAESVLINGILKPIINRQRPEPPDDRPHVFREPITSSFPSGHASSSFMMASILGAHSKRKWWLYLLAAGIAGSRVHVRIHHASDILAGAGLGLLLAKLVRALTGKWSRRHQ